MFTQIIIGPLSLSSYTFWIGLCALLGVAWCFWQAGGSWRDRLSVVDALLLVGVCTLAAGCAGYIALNAAYFAEQPAEITLTPAAGIAEHAAVVGMLIGWQLSKRLRRPHPLSMAALASLVGIGASIGCISNACAYGREVFWTDGILWHLRVDWPDAYWTSNPRLPTQTLMAAWLVMCIAIPAVPSFRGKGAPHPLILWTVLFSAGDFILQFGRADPASTLLGLRSGQVLDIALFAVGSGLIVAGRLTAVTSQRED
ncbi:MAG: prolipoprotein diacylglyceryl transferase family protein [Anaerolineae bacterium]